MPSTYTSNNKIQKIATGEQSGTWGNTTNTNFDLFDTAIDGFVNITLSGTTHTLNIPDGSAGDGRNKVLVFTGTLAATNTVSVTPNTVKKHYYVQNNTTGGQNIVISQGSGSSVTIKPGYSSIVYLDGAGSGAAVKEVLTSLKLTALLEATGAVLNGSSSGSTTLQASATASGTLTLPAATDTLVGKATTDTFTNKTFDTAGTGNVLRINGTQVSAVTGTGSVVLATSPTLVTPLLGTPTSGTLTNCTGLPVSSGVSGLGTGVATALAVNVGSAGALVVNGGALGTPSSGTLTSCTGLPVSTGISGLGANVSTFLATPSSANLAGAVTDETGSGALVFANSPVLVTPVLGTPASGTLTNCSGLPISGGVSGLGSNVATFLATPSSANLANAVTDETGTGALVFGTSPTIATPTITTSAVIPLVNGGTTASSTLTLQSTSGTGTSDAILFKTGSQQERMRITTSGAVGIGVTPSYTLEVRDAGSNSSIAISNSGATGELLSTITNATGVATISSLKQLSVSVENAEPLIFKTTGSERMRILSTGEVGIGTSSPGEKLVVVGNIVAGNTGTTADGYIDIDGGATGKVRISRTGTGATASGMVFYTQFSTLQERMRILSTGEVGIGTSSPSEALGVNGTVGIGNQATTGTAGALRIVCTGGANYIQSGQNKTTSSAAPLIFTNMLAGSEWMRIDSSGNLLVGTTSSLAKLTAAGGTAVGAVALVTSGQTGTTVRSNSVFRIQSEAAGRDVHMQFSDNVANATEIGMISGSTYFCTGALERMRIDSSGNVGIGTGSTIRSILNTHVGTITGPAVTAGLTLTAFYNGVTAANTIDWNYSGQSASPVRLGATFNSDGNGMEMVFYTSTAFNATGSERMRINKDGNVGIGTSSPSYRLDVRGGDISVSRGTSSAADASIYFGSNSNNYIYSGNSSNIFAIATNGSERMRIDSSGNVGIGTSSPTAKLNVLSNRASVTYGQVWDFYNGGSFENSVILGFNGSASVFGNFQSYPLTFHNGATERMRIDTAGNVKVGGTADRATTAGTNQVVIFNGTAPVGTLANGCSFYSTAGEMRVMDAAGNATLLSPHDSVTNEWIYDSSHTPSGKRLKINVERLLRFINDHFGLDCVHDLMEEA